MSLEFTGELNDEGFSVTECIGGSMELDEGQLGLRYQVGILLNDFYFVPVSIIYFFTHAIYANFHPFFYSPSAIRD